MKFTRYVNSWFEDVKMTKFTYENFPVGTRIRACTLGSSAFITTNPSFEIKGVVISPKVVPPGILANAKRQGAELFVQILNEGIKEIRYINEYWLIELDSYGECSICNEPIMGSLHYLCEKCQL